MDNQHSNLRREGDELICHHCGKRWGIDEPAPECNKSPEQDDE